jgi:hypothetical protein
MAGKPNFSISSKYYNQELYFNYFKTEYNYTYIYATVFSCKAGVFIHPLVVYQNQIGLFFLYL